MATEVIHTVAPSGGDYTSLAAWENAQARDLVTDDEIAVAEFETFVGGLDDDDAFTGGWTTDSTRYIYLRAAAGHEQSFSSRKAGFYFAPTSGNACLRPVTAAADFQIDDIEFDCSATVPSQQTPFTSSNGGGLTAIIRRITIDSVGNGDALSLTNTGDAQDIDQILVIGGADDNIVVSDSAQINHALCTNASNRGFVLAGASCDVKNSFFMGSTGNDFDDQSGSRDWIATDDATAAGATTSYPSRTPSSDLVDDENGPDYRTAIGSTLEDGGESSTFVGCDVETVAIERPRRLMGAGYA